MYLKFVFSGNVGTGIVMKRNKEDGSWSREEGRRRGMGTLEGDERCLEAALPWSEPSPPVEIPRLSAFSLETGSPETEI